MRRLTLAILFALGIMAAPVHAGEPTPTEQAAEACEQPEIVAEFGHGSVDYCYDAYLDELNPDATPKHINVFEDGSGVLDYVVVNHDGSSDWHERTFPADTFTWDCATMGNHVCGSPVSIIEPAVLTELPRTN